jgi:CelD/BcsL family acetyltransferase involved in cellulose biosynthesis
VQSVPSSPVAAPASEDAPSRALTITVERTVDALAAHTAAWEELAANAADPNPFYEPYALLASLRLLPDAKDVEVVLVWAANPLPKQPAFLVGLFPLVRRTRYKGLPLVTLSTWKHLYQYLGTPLVRHDRAAEVLDAFFAWARDAAGGALVEWRTIRSDGAFRHALTDALARNGLTSFVESAHTRAMFRPAESTEAYLDRAMGGKKKKELRRQERRLGEQGVLAYVDATDTDGWIDEFLMLEARGWKNDTSMQGDPIAGDLFRAYCKGAHERGRWMAMALRLDGRAIAMKVNLRMGDGALAFKIAYDESLAKFSPGVLLELEHVRRLHEPGAPAWVDSGAAAEHPMINHLWRDRAGIETLVTSTGRASGSLAIAAFPLVRFARSTLKRLKPPKP